MFGDQSFFKPSDVRRKKPRRGKVNQDESYVYEQEQES